MNLFPPLMQVRGLVTHLLLETITNLAKFIAKLMIAQMLTTVNTCCHYWHVLHSDHGNKKSHVDIPVVPTVSGLLKKSLYDVGH